MKCFCYCKMYVRFGKLFVINNGRGIIVKNIFGVSVGTVKHIVHKELLWE